MLAPPASGTSRRVNQEFPTLAASITRARPWPPDAGRFLRQPRAATRPPSRLATQAPMKSPRPAVRTTSPDPVDEAQVKARGLGGEAEPSRGRCASVRRPGLGSPRACVHARRARDSGDVIQTEATRPWPGWPAAAGRTGPDRTSPVTA